MVSTENVMKKVQEYMKLHQDEIKGEEDMNRLLSQFMTEYNSSLSSVKKKSNPTTADDYLELAEEASTKKKKIEYLKKAVSLDSDNIDANVQLVLIEKEDEMEELLSSLSAIIKKAESDEKLQKHLASDAGDFWMILDTRPYMRARQEYMHTLIGCGMMTAAMEEGKVLLKLNKNDNQGIRYTQMHLYAFCEDEKSALALHKKYKNEDESMLLLPLAVLFYKKQEFDKAGEYLLRLQSSNKGTRNFFRKVVNDGDLSEIFENMDSAGYSPYTEEELAVDFMENSFLFITSPGFFKWGYRFLTKKK